MDSLHCESMNNVKFTAVILIQLFASILALTLSLSLSLSLNRCISQFNSKSEKTKMTEMTLTTAAFSP